MSARLYREAAATAAASLALACLIVLGGAGPWPAGLGGTGPAWPVGFGGGQVAQAAQVTLRVEGSAATLFEGPVTTGTGTVDGGDGTGPHPCTGPLGYPPGPTATRALDVGLRAAGIGWRGNWNPDFHDFFVDRIGPDASAPPLDYWSLLRNGTLGSGGCSMQVADGDEVLFAHAVLTRSRGLRLSGPATASPGQPFTVRVVDVAGGGGEPVAGATVRSVAPPLSGGLEGEGGVPGGGPTGAVSPAMSSSAGQATLVAPAAGVIRLKAEHPEGIRSNALVVCVGMDRSCEQPVAPGGGDRPGPGGGGGKAGRGASRAEQRRLARAAARYLMRAQKRGGGLGYSRGAKASLTMTGWAALAYGLRGNRRPALAASRWLIRRLADSPRLADRVRSAAALSAVAALPVRCGRTGGLLEARGARRCLRRSRMVERKARELASGLVRRQRGDGSFAGDVNTTALAVVAIAGRRPGAVRRAADWLVSTQRPNGGFGYRPEVTPDVDSTGAAAWALALAAKARSVSAPDGRVAAAAGRARALRRAAQFVATTQTSEGGFPSLPGGRANSQSTAFGLIALRLAGIGPRGMRSVGGDRDPLQYLASLGRPGGSVAYDRHTNRTPVWTTAQSLIALTGRQTLLRPARA